MAQHQTRKKIFNDTPISKKILNNDLISCLAAVQSNLSSNYFYSLILS